jgi:hypothetical protein
MIVAQNQNLSMLKSSTFTLARDLELLRTLRYTLDPGSSMLIFPNKKALEFTTGTHLKWLCAQV